MKKYAYRPLAVASLAALVLSCSSSKDDDDKSGKSGGTFKFTVTVTDGKFDPPTLTAEDSATVTITLVNNGTVPHTWVATEIPTSRVPETPPKETRSVTFTTPRKEKVYDVRCDVAGHTESGSLVVK